MKIKYRNVVKVCRGNMSRSILSYKGHAVRKMAISRYYWAFCIRLWSFSLKS